MAFIGNPAETLSSPVKFSPQRQGNLHIKNDIDDIHTVCTTEIFTRKFVSGDCFMSIKLAFGCCSQWNSRIFKIRKLFLSVVLRILRATGTRAKGTVAPLGSISILY
jgi:hypothetical protein